MASVDALRRVIAPFRAGFAMGAAVAVAVVAMGVGGLDVAGPAAAAPRPDRTPYTLTAMTLDADWTQVPGGAGTGCARGGAYSFFVHKGNPRNLLVFLDGGGACWSAATCVEHPTYAATVDSTTEPGELHGILDFTRPDNPFYDFTVVRIPYCTGDVHLGRRDVVYDVVDSTGAVVRSVRIHHGGNTNVEDALAHAFRTILDPRVVVVAGSSAGSVASPFYAAVVAEHYPRARIVQLGDASGAYRGPSISRTIAKWGTTAVLHEKATYRDLDSSKVTAEAIYQRAARAAPRVRFAQFNTAADSIQVLFLKLLGQKKPRLDSLLAASFREIRTSIPGFRSYTAPGPMHSVLRRSEFYTLRVDGVRFRDWVGSLVQGKRVRNVGDRYLRNPRGIERRSERRVEPRRERRSERAPGSLPRPAAVHLVRGLDHEHPLVAPQFKQE